MKIKRFLPSALLLGFLASAASQINAQTRPEYIPLGGGVKGAPDSERAAIRCRRRLLESLAKTLDTQQDFSDIGLDEPPFWR